MSSTHEAIHAAPANGPGRVAAFCWAILVLGVVAVGWVLVPFWMSRPEHNDRFLIPLTALWLAWRMTASFSGRTGRFLMPLALLWLASNARTRFLETPRRPSWLGFGLLVPAILLFVVGWYLQSQIGTRTVLLWWLTL